MKLEKKHWAMLIAGVVILFLVYWFFFRKKKSESGYDSNILIYGNDSSYDPAFPVIGESGFRVSPRSSAVSGSGIASKTVPTGPIRQGVKTCPCPKGWSLPSPL